MKVNISIVDDINKILKEEKKFNNSYHKNPTIKELSNILNISEERIKKLRKIYEDSKIDYTEYEVKPFRVEDLSKEEYDVYVELIDKNKDVLNDIEREMLLYTFGLIDDRLWTIMELSCKYNRSEERIRQIIAKGIRKVKNSNRKRIGCKFYRI